MGLGAVIGGVAAIGSAVIGSSAAGNAADVQAQAARDSNATQLQMYNQTRSDQAPFRSVGYGALGKLAAMYGVQPSAETTRTPSAPNFSWDGGLGFNYTGGAGSSAPAMPSEYQTNYDAASKQPYGGFEASPGYQFRIDEARRALESSAAARGLLKSGATVKAINRQVQGVASDEYNTYANRLAALAGVGQTATNTTNAAGQAYAGQVGANNANAANATASGYINQANAMTGGIQNAASSYLYSKAYGGGGGSTYVPYTGGRPDAGLYADAGRTIASNASMF